MGVGKSREGERDMVQTSINLAYIYTHIHTTVHTTAHVPSIGDN